MPNAATATKTLHESFCKIMDMRGFKGTDDASKFEKKSAEKSFSIKGQENNPKELSIRVRVTNKATGKKTETIFHHVNSVTSILNIMDSLSFG